MIAIKPVSDLRNYNEVLQDVTDDSPVFLTKNGRGCYAVISIKDYEKLTATRRLFSELKKGEESTGKNGWLDTKDVRKMAEDAKVAVRSIRREGMDTAKQEQKDGEMTEDELKQAEYGSQDCRNI